MENNDKNDILGAISIMSAHMDERFDKVEVRLDKVEGRLDKVEKDVVEMKSTMVTKDHLEDRLAKYHGDLVILMRKEDAKIRMLVEILKEKETLVDADVKRVLSLEPFPQLYV